MSFRSLTSYLLTALLLLGCASPPDRQDRTALPPLRDLTAFVLVDPATDDVLTVDQAAAKLSDADVIFLGENHRHIGNHLTQMALFRALHEIKPDIALSLEQFERDVQPVVDQYLAGEIGEATLRAEGRAWPNYQTSYRPLVEYAKTHGLAVIAANAPTMVVRCVGRQGPSFLDTLPEDKRHLVAKTLRLDDGPYRDKFFTFAGADTGHGVPANENDTVSAAVIRSYAAQVTRDETMAESIVTHIAENPGRTVVHLNGSFHSAGFLGTAERVLWDRPDLKVAVVHPIEVDDPATPSIPAGMRGEGTLLLLVAPIPLPYMTMAEQREAIRAQIRTRQSVECEL